MVEGNILRFDNRPFKDIKEMEDTLIANWNSVVKAGDNVYHLGDFCWGTEKEWLPLLKKLNGNIHIIRGNHDLKHFSSETMSELASVRDYLELTDNGRHVILSHYPILCYKASYNPDCYMLHGHVHTTRESEFVKKWTRELRESKTTNSDSCGNLINVGCMLDYMDYTPRTLDYLIEKLNNGDTLK